MRKAGSHAENLKVYVPDEPFTWLSNIMVIDGEPFHFPFPKTQTSAGSTRLRRTQILSFLVTLSILPAFGQ